MYSMHTYSRKIKTPCNKNLDVFDFKPETEVAEFSIRTKSKLENPRRAIDKYAFLETAASGKSIAAEEINYVPSLTVESINMNHMAITLVENPSAGMMTDPDDAFTVVKQHPQSSSEVKTDLSESEVNVAVTSSASPSNNKVKSAILDFLPSLHEVVCSDDLRSMSEFQLKCSQKLNRVQDEADGMGTNESMCERFSSSSGVAENDGPSSDHCIDEWEMENEDVTKVILYPDHVLYRGTYYTDPLICFTSSFIEMEGSEVGGDDKTFKCKWGVEDILHIMSHWHERVEMAMVQIHVLTKDTIHAENVECTTGCTELKFPVVDSSWYERLEAIATLNITYKALWTNMLESEDTLLSSSRYLPIFDRPFEEVVYPKGDADAVSISQRDFDLLQPSTFVNDTIIDFYIKYLKNKINPDENRRFHFFNSFFFRKLADPDKDPLDASKGAVAYQRVKKWTRKVNLFEKDYVFIPVNYNYHWSLIVFCHLGEVATYEDEDVNESMKVPCILHMDSIRGSHTGLQGLVQSYLKEEWKARQQVDSEDIASRFDDLRFISLELPQQQNLFDCGLFLLHYVELFLEQAPLQFNPFKISQSFSFLNVDWFPPAEASLKRLVIQKLICDLLENPHQELHSTASNDQQCHINSLTTNAHKDTVVNLPLEDFNHSMHHQSSHNHQEVEIPSSLIQCAGDPNITLKPSFESDFNCETIFDECLGSLTPVEEDVQQNDGIMPDDSVLPCSSQDCRTQEPWQANNNHETSCDDSIEIVNENSQPDSEIGQPRSPLSLVDTLHRCDDQKVDGDVEDDPASMGVIIPGSSFNFHDTGVVGSESSSGLESDVQHPTKRMRVTQPQKVSLL
ncbi:hypothetical protein SSX86_010700 [Deinandra increscens subsp. villosa]|uniref:Ubiquitin-like protease family profile domain-containing protein n=1 Tax=Deinandra increscens subsp. villosa TaxID=3103831 RepID=A0AAP0D805_9ASTR